MLSRAHEPAGAGRDPVLEVGEVVPRVLAQNGKIGVVFRVVVTRMVEVRVQVAVPQHQRRGNQVLVLDPAVAGKRQLVPAADAQRTCPVAVILRHPQAELPVVVVAVEQKLGGEQVRAVLLVQN